MFTLNLVISPFKLETLTLDAIDPALEIKDNGYTGRLGMKSYHIELNDEELYHKLQENAAVPYCVTMLTDVLDSYPYQDFIDMISLHMFKVINARPDGVEVIKFAQPRTTHVYPMYDSEYLYVCDEESVLLSVNAFCLLGVHPVTDNPICWSNMKLTNPISYGGACLVASEEVDSVALDQIDRTLAKLHQNRKYLAVVTDDNVHSTLNSESIIHKIGNSCNVGPEGYNAIN